MVNSNIKSGHRANFGSRVLFFALLLMWVSRCAAVSEKQGVMLGWDASVDSNVVGYAVYSGTNSGTYTTRVDMGTNTTGLVPGLVPGAGYCFVVVAYDANGLESLPSNEILVQAPVPLHMTMGATPSSPVTLHFTVAAGHWHELQATSDLSNWTTLWQTSVAAVNSWVQYQDFPQGAAQSQRFYRLVLH
ncbi:MAG: Fibronectin, type domain protein [Pedosphaera sp.]|nr:Fibronectin, type domain protein [Pedosphaera sp.]